MPSTNSTMPLIEYGYNNTRVPGQLGGEIQQPDVQPASHHALNTAYNDLKKRYNDLEQKNKTLLRKLKELQRPDGIRTSSLSSVDLTPTASRESSPQISGSAFSANGAVTSSEEQLVNVTLQQLEGKLFKLQEHEQKLLDEKVRLTDRCQNVERANATLSSENIEIKKTQQSLFTQFKARENDWLDKNAKLENENEQYMRQNISLEKRFKFLEKLLKEQKVKNSYLEEEYLLSKSELQEEVSHSHIGDENESVIEELKGTVHQYHVELRDLLNVVCDQKKLIDQLLSREADRNSILSCHRRRSRDSSAISSAATSHGARPKTSQRSPSFKSKPASSQQEAGSDNPDQGASVNLPQKEMLNPYDGVMHDKYHRRSTSQGSYETRSFHGSSGKNGSDVDKSCNEYGNQSYKGEAMENWLGQLSMARNDSLEHLNDDMEDVFGNLDVLDNLDDNTAGDQDREGRSPSGATARPGLYPSSTLPRQSHRLTVQDMQGFNTGNSLNVQAAHPRSTSADRDRDSRRSSAGVMNSELENRYRPNSASQQPRPLNIERNEDVTNTRRSYDNTSQNVNLNVQTDKNRPERPDNLILNNDPLVGHKVIPNRNIYREEEYMKEGRQVAATLAEAMHTCPMCNVDFPTSAMSMEEFQQHVLECCDSTEPALQPSPLVSGGARLTVEARICPVCNSEFPFLIDQKDFEDHVNGHFEEEERNRFEMIEP